MKQFDLIHQQYTRVRPAYPAAVYDEIAADLRAVPAELAVDLACGSGQSIDGLKRIARQIIGVDIGPNLPADARRRHPEATFVQGSGEAPGLDPGIADVVTIATAFYWMDRARVIENVSSQLKPHGVFAVYKYVDFLASTSYVSKFIAKEVGNESFLADFTEELRRAGGEELLVNFDITMVIASR